MRQSRYPSSSQQYYDYDDYGDSGYSGSSHMSPLMMSGAVLVVALIAILALFMSREYHKQPVKKNPVSGATTTKQSDASFDYVMIGLVGLCIIAVLALVYFLLKLKKATVSLENKLGDQAVQIDQLGTKNRELQGALDTVTEATKKNTEMTKKIGGGFADSVEYGRDKLNSISDKVVKGAGRFGEGFNNVRGAINYMRGR